MEIVANYIDIMVNDVNNGKNLDGILGKLYDYAIQYVDCEKSEKIAEVIQEAAESVDVNTAIFLHSLAININKKNKSLKKMLKYICIHFEEFEIKTKYFLYCQCNSYIFQNPKTRDYEITTLLYDILKNTLDGYRKEFTDKLRKIEVKERKKGFVLVLIDGYLREDNSDKIMHAPTKTANDRCKVLIERLGKKILLINTAESNGVVGGITFVHMMQGNYAQWCSSVDTMMWKGCKIPFFQCDYNMPDLDTMGMLFDTILKQKPEYAITIGGGIITGNLIADMIPVLSVGTVPSDVNVTMAQFQTFSGKMSDENLDFLKYMNKDLNNVIESTFTYSLVEKNSNLLRSDVGLSEKSFVISIMGARLDADIDYHFIEIMDEICESDVEFLLIGSFRNRKDTFDKNIEKFPKLKSKIYYVGMIDDPLAYLELCDINLNPPRMGGGGSGVESLNMGKPVVTMNFGDVATVCGDRYCVSSIDELIDIVKRYKNDSYFYEKQSKYALVRAEELLDSSKEFSRVIKEFERRVEESGI